MESKWPKMRRIPASQREIAVENMISEMKVMNTFLRAFLILTQYCEIRIINMKN